MARPIDGFVGNADFPAFENARSNVDGCWTMGADTWSLHQLGHCRARPPRYARGRARAGGESLGNVVGPCRCYWHKKQPEASPPAARSCFTS